MDKIGLGGGCHWCTEAVFQSLMGVSMVEQGFIAPENRTDSFSEAVIVHYDKKVIGLKDLIEIHLHTHKSTAAHSMRNKYRSAVYAFDEESLVASQRALKVLQRGFKELLVTQVLPFKKFKPSDAQFHSYYFSNPEKPFCETYISPKLRLLLHTFSGFVNVDKVNNNGGL